MDTQQQRRVLRTILQNIRQHEKTDRNDMNLDVHRLRHRKFTKRQKICHFVIFYEIFVSVCRRNNSDRLRLVMKQTFESVNDCKHRFTTIINRRTYQKLTKIFQNVEFLCPQISSNGFARALTTFIKF